MERVVKVKVRKIGTSLGVLIPKKFIEESSVKEGEEIEIALLKRKKELVNRFFGMARGAKHFHRDKEDRVN
jgi:antitoxin component of MazEF toxin-antitoxin module